MIEINWNPSRRELRQFATIWLPAFAALAGVAVVYRWGSWNAATVLWSVAAVSMAIGLARPQLARPLFLGLTLATYPIGWVVSNVVLVVIYYGLFTFVALLMRLFRYDALKRARHAVDETYWVVHDQRTEPRAYFRQF
jgi:hypothetical protein